jgi:hypothetical protein
MRLHESQDTLHPAPRLPMPPASARSTSVARRLPARSRHDARSRATARNAFNRRTVARAALPLVARAHNGGSPRAAYPIVENVSAT